MLLISVIRVASDKQNQIPLSPTLNSILPMYNVSDLLENFCIFWYISFPNNFEDKKCIFIF